MSFINKLVFVMLLFCSASASAELYKWTDEQGNIHFSDTKPGTTEPAGVEGLPVPHVAENARDASGTSYARVERPIKNPYTLSRSIELSKVSIDREKILTDASQRGDHSGNRCKVGIHNFIATNKRFTKTKNAIKVYFNHTARKLGYKVAEKKQLSFFSLFDGGNNSDADLSLVVKLNDIQTNSCVKKFIAVTKHSLSTYHQAAWTLYDNKNGEIIFNGITKGYSNHLYHSSRVYKNGIDENDDRSIQNMIANLFADKEFVEKFAQ